MKLSPLLYSGYHKYDNYNVYTYSIIIIIVPQTCSFISQQYRLILLDLILFAKELVFLQAMIHKNLFWIWIFHVPQDFLGKEQFKYNSYTCNGDVPNRNCTKMDVSTQYSYSWLHTPQGVGLPQTVVSPPAQKYLPTPLSGTNSKKTVDCINSQIQLAIEFCYVSYVTVFNLFIYSYLY